MSTLRWQQSGGGERTVTLGPGDLTIGRDADNAIRVDSQYVSKHHAVVRASASGFVIEDLGSSNGTFVNGQRITRTALASGDRVEIGQEQFMFQAAPAAATRPMAAPPPEAVFDPIIRAPASAAPLPRPGAVPAPPSRAIRPGVLIGAGAALVLVLLLAILFGGRKPADSPRPSPDAPAAASPAALPPEPPIVGGASPAPSAAGAAGQAAEPPLAVGTVAAPAPPSPAAAVRAASVPPGANAGTLYDLAISNIKGGRLVEAQQLLVASLQQDPQNVSARERLRQVAAAIQIEAEKHLTAGQRAFTYLKFDDAIIEWEQVIAMTPPDDTRHRQAVDGIARARARLAER